jgi:hypothetical protein
MRNKIVVGSIIISIILIIPITLADKSDECSVSNEYKEVYTIISGSCHSRVINRWGLFRNVELYAGQSQTSLTVDGKRHNSTGIGVEDFSEMGVKFIHSPCYLGLIKKISDMPPRYSVGGIAFGDIEYR